MRKRLKRTENGAEQTGRGRQSRGKKALLIRLLRFCLTAGIVLLVVLFSINFYVKQSTKKAVLSGEQEADWGQAGGADCILVLGAGVWGDRPSPMLRDRLDRAVEVYNARTQDGQPVSSTIVMSGDHGTKAYDEVNIMKEYAVTAGVPSENIFMDHAGFSTYDSLYRIRDIFGAKKVIIISQKYHLYRALYIAKKLGLDAYGIDADVKQYKGAASRELREILARNKDVFKCMLRPEASVMGEPISLKQSGDVTND